jgi:hypothetical protein
MLPDAGRPIGTARLHVQIECLNPDDAKTLRGT